jgi:hypothetical protein
MFQEANPDLVARFLAGWLRGINYMKNPANLEELMMAFREFGEETLPGRFFVADSVILENLELSVMYNLEEQLEIFDRSEGDSVVDGWYTGVGDFMTEIEMIAENPEAASYITDEYLKLVDANETLKAFTLMSDPIGVDMGNMTLPEGVTPPPAEEEEMPTDEETSIPADLEEMGPPPTNETDDTEGLQPITVSIQPGTFWSVPFWLALQKGFFEELGLDVSYVLYSSGAPQVADGKENKTWDVGAAGSVPNILASPEIQTIMISNEEGGLNVLVGNARGANRWPPESMEGVPVAITPNSTGHYAAVRCLQNTFPDITQDAFLFLPPSDVVKSLREQDVDYGALWTPYLYLFLNNVFGSQKLCVPTDIGLFIPGGLMARTEFAVGFVLQSSVHWSSKISSL